MVECASPAKLHTSIKMVRSVQQWQCFGCFVYENVYGVLVSAALSALNRGCSRYTSSNTVAVFRRTVANGYKNAESQKSSREHPQEQKY